MCAFAQGEEGIAGLGHRAMGAIERFAPNLQRAADRMVYAHLPLPAINRELSRLITSSATLMSAVATKRIAFTGVPEPRLQIFV